MDFADIKARIESTFPDALITGEEADQFLRVEASRWRDVARFLHEDPDLHFDSLMCLSGYDNGPDQSLGVAYNLHSMEKLHKLEIRTEVPHENGSIPSVALIWRIADWFEREVYDMYGITFEGHPDHRRMLLPEDWIGHPLRKDYTTPDYYHGIPVPKDKRGWE
jgi:NADH-quinone oxidoreductase subunit C